MTFEELADEKCLVSFVSRIVHRADVRMRDQRRETCFAAEPIERARARHVFGAEQLDRDFAIEAEVACAVSSADPSRPIRAMSS